MELFSIRIQRTFQLVSTQEKNTFAETIIIQYIMALEIKAIPTLKGKEAERFVKEADKAYQKKEKTDFSKQVKIARAILRKANMI